MARPLAPEILRVITSPYVVSLINLDSSLQAVGPHEIQAWAESHPCQTKALAKATVNSLQYCPYGLPVIERLGVVAQLKDEMLVQKPVLLDTLIRNSLQDDMNFDKFSPALVALLSTPLPAAFPPPAKLVAFFLKCLDRATKAPSIDTIRPLYVLVANGYRHLALQMSDSQSHSFAKRMAGFLAEKGSANVNWFLMYCLATLAHMHLASSATERQSWAIGEIFQGKKAATVLGLVINVVNVLASPETKVDWQEKVQIIKMATVVADAVSDTVKSTGATSADAASLKRLLEKTKALDDDRVVSEMLQFVSALSLMTPQAPLKMTIQELVKRNRKEQTSSMFLPTISIGFFAQAAPADLIEDMLQSVLKCASKSSESISSFYLLLRDRIEFIQKLNQIVPDSPKLRQGVLEALSIDAVDTLVEGFIRHEVHEPTATEVCGDGEACRWVIADLTNQLQKALCSFLLRCIMYSQAAGASTIPPSRPDSLMEKLSRISGARHECPFANALKTGTSSSRDFLSLIEESASPEARISSHNWRQSLMDGLARETGRQHGFIVSAVGEICRDLESRCETVEEPLRVEKETSRQLQNELEEWKAKHSDAEEQVARSLHDLGRATEENAKLEAKLDGAVSKTKETIGRIKELETVLERQREAASRAFEDLERTSEQAKTVHLEELRDAEDAAERAAMENMAALNERQEMIDELQEHQRELEQDVEDAEGEIRTLKEEKVRFEETVQGLRKLVSELQHDVNESREQTRSMQEDLHEKSEHLRNLTKEGSALRDDNDRLQENKTILANRIEAVEKDLYEKRTTLVRKLLDIERQDQVIDELVYETTRQKHHMALSQKIHDELQENVQRIQLELEAMKQDHIQKSAELHTELSTKYDQQITKIKSEHSDELSQIGLNHETEVGSLRDKLLHLKDEHQQANDEWRKEYESQQQEIDTLREKLNKFRALYEEREKEAQNIGRQLLGLMSGTKPDLAGLFGGGDKASLDALANTPPPARKTAVPARRKPSDSDSHHSDDNYSKRTKTTHHSPPTAHRRNSRLPKTPHRRISAAAGSHNLLPATQADDLNAVKETPVSPAETDYGTAPVLTSTPNGHGLGLMRSNGGKQQYRWQSSARRKTMPAFRSPQKKNPQEMVEVVDDDCDDLDEEEALLRGVAEAGWDETTI